MKRFAQMVLRRRGSAIIIMDFTGVAPSPSAKMGQSVCGQPQVKRSMDVGNCHLISLKTCHTQFCVHD